MNDYQFDSKIVFLPKHYPHKNLILGLPYKEKLFRQTQEYHVLDDLLIQDPIQDGRELILLLIWEICGLDRVARFVVSSVYPRLPDVLSFQYIGESSSSSLADSSASSRH